ncbi:MAG: carboxylesterase/lipase family protein [Chloroflexi bacterium]|nr:carboxylesterase/lipase family protein [Chloroflexota bacterium]
MTTIVKTSHGSLQGERAAGGSLSFRGIPFAKPPLGPLRFRAPEPPPPWTGTRDATHPGHAALQAASPIGDLLGIKLSDVHEDCLYLNVWTPALDGRRPVMVWFHGGAFVIGAGSQPLYDGAGLAARGDVVVVTVNYRLGLFGFLHGKTLCGDALASSGNEGILDQIAALRWVRDEIAAFGGDPTNVTIFGESAGSISIAAILGTPAADGLYHKAILQSGSANLLATPEAASKATAAVLAEAGLSPQEAGRLRDLPAARLLEIQDKVTPRSGGMSYAPVVDGEVVPRSPFDVVAEGGRAGVPMLIGTTADELKLFQFMDPSFASLDEPGLLARAEALTRGHGKEAIEVYRSSRAARGESTTPAETWSAMNTDQVFRYPAMRLAELQSAHQPQTFAYLFTWKSPAMGGVLGSCHALELAFLWGLENDPAMTTFAGSGPAAETLSNRVQDAWLAFARTGNPGHGGLPEWPRYDASRRATMLLGDSCHVENGPREPERAFWAAPGA